MPRSLLKTLRLLEQSHVCSSFNRLASSQSDGQQYRWLKLRSQGHRVNPCNSKLHPAVTEARMDLEGEEEISVQAAYTPESSCWGCGPAAEGGLGLQSFRIPNGLQGRLRLAKKYQAFPQIVNGGVVSALFDCHGNWTAAIALMDRSGLPRPPLTLTSELLVNYKEPTPPDANLVVRSAVVKIRDTADIGSGKTSVQVDLALCLEQPAGQEKLLASATGIFKKLGALRAL